MTRLLVTSLVSLALLIGSFGPTRAVTEPPDSVEDYTLGLSFHEYDGFNVGATFHAFADVFQLFVTDLVDAQRDSSSMAEIIQAIMDDDTTNTDDVFPIVWNYFCFNDLDSPYNGIDYVVPSGRYQRIGLYQPGHHDQICSAFPRRTREHIDI